MRPYHIALLHYSCPPVVGGVEEVVRQQANLFYRYFQSVKIFAGAGNQFTNNYPVEINPLLSSRNRQIQKAHQAALEGDFQPLEELALRIHSYLKERLQGFDVLIAHNVLTMGYNIPLTYAILRLAQDNQLPIISWNHDSPYFYKDYPSHLNKAPWIVLKKFHSKIYYVVISESRKAQFGKLYGTTERIFVVPNGIDPIQFFKLDPTTIRLIQEQKLFEDDFIMVQPSRLHPRKNIELSIRVIRALQDRGIRARLLLTGAYDPHEPKSVEYYRRLVALAKELKVSQQVIIIAEYRFSSGQPLTPERIIIRDLYLIADVLFLPSLQEGFGIPLLESGMIKLPVICSNIPPFREIGSNDVCYFSPNDPPEKIAEQMLHFLKSIPTQRMFRRVIKTYAWDNIYLYKLKPLLDNIIQDFYTYYR